MAEIDDALKLVAGPHLEALTWFKEHTGQNVPWVELQKHAEDGARLVNQAKGIYKPVYTEHSLSVRQTLGGPYADRPVERRADGSWLYQYFQENPDPAQRDREATNRGLMACMRDGIPVGVLLQTKPKPGVEYEVLGLAAVRDWRDGYFLLEGFDIAGNTHRRVFGGDAADARSQVVAEEETQDFEHENEADLRERAVAEVVRRRGQAKFRTALLEAYGGRCAITGCDAVDALEAAHILPYRGDHSNHPSNGLLLRADLHSLFDLGLIAIDEEHRVIVAPRLVPTEYGDLSGKKIAETAWGNAPSLEALAAHQAWAGL